MVLLKKQKHKEKSGNLHWALLQLVLGLGKATPPVTAVSLQVNGGAWTSETPGTGLSSYIMWFMTQNGRHFELDPIEERD